MNYNNAKFVFKVFVENTLLCDVQTFTIIVRVCRLFLVTCLILRISVTIMFCFVISLLKDL